MTQHLEPVNQQFGGQSSHAEPISRLDFMVGCVAGGLVTKLHDGSPVTDLAATAVRLAESILDEIDARETRE